MKYTIQENKSRDYTLIDENNNLILKSRYLDVIHRHIAILEQHSTKGPAVTSSTHTHTKDSDKH